MQDIGEVRFGNEIGYKHNSRFVWQACERCGKERWVQLIGSEARWKCCRRCGVLATNHNNRGANHYNWRGGVANDSRGYLVQRLHRDSPFAPMLNNKKSNSIMQHRLIMAQHLGRCLESWEHVHHLNGIKNDNRTENLALTDSRRHEKHTLNTLLQKRIVELEG